MQKMQTFFFFFVDKMAKANIPQYDSTPSNNSDINSINIAESCPASNINNAIRELMAHLKDMDTGTTALTSPSFTAMSTDTISEKTSANGVAIDSVTLKDGELGTTASPVPINSSSLNGGQFGGRRNVILNPKMELAQRGTSAFSITTAGNTYTLDRWRANASGGGQFSVQQDSESPTGFIKSSKVTVTTADSSIGSSDFYHFRQTIEGYNFAPFGFGASGAKTMTLSFYVRSSVTGTYNILLRNNAGNRGYLTTYTINSANTWERKTITVDGDVTGTYPTDNTGSLIISYSFGGNATGTINQWGTAIDEKSSGTVDLIATGSATWYITGVQLELGSVATPFEHRSFGEELSLCQRYYQAFTYRSGGIRDSSVSVEHFSIGYLAPMRATPSLSVWDFDKQSHVVGDLSTNAPSTIHYNTGGISFQWASTDSGYRNFGYRVTGNIGLNSEL